MSTPLFRSREGTEFPIFLYDLALDMFAVVQHWEPPAVPAYERGRLFESVLYRYCHTKKLHLTE